MSSNPKDIVLEFLKNNGYPFEMKVAKEFQMRGFGIHQSVYYTDPHTNVPREIDLVAQWIENKGNYNFNVIFVIECKYAKTPWILFSSITKGFPMCYVTSNKGNYWLQYLSRQQFFENFFELESKYGYGITVSNPKVNESAKDNAYGALQTLLSFLKSESISPKFSTPQDFTIYVPIIAIRGKLFEASLNKNSEIICDEIQQAQVFYKENINNIIPKLHIVTEDKLEDYILRLKQDCERLFIDPYFNNSIIHPPLSEL